MGSIVPFQDLNLMPSPSTAASTAAAATLPLLTPKIEPKTEPFDEPVPTHQLERGQNTPESLLSESAPGFFSNSENTPESQPPDRDNVYSEFYRISELFRTAFAKRLRKYGDVDVLDPDSRAIVTVTHQDAQLSNAVVPRTKPMKRSIKFKLNLLIFAFH